MMKTTGFLNLMTSEGGTGILGISRGGIAGRHPRARIHTVMGQARSPNGLVVGQFTDPEVVLPDGTVDGHSLVGLVQSDR
jgi:hypothetical protein